MHKLENKVSVVTGAASGMGKAIAKLFAEHGSRVILADLDATKLDIVGQELTQDGATFKTVSGDITQEDTVSAIFAAADELGGIDVLVNNAGIMDDFNGAGDQPQSVWDRTMAININAPYRLSHLAIQSMLTNDRGGAIVNNSSLCALVGARAGAAYTASKHAMVGLTKNTAYMYLRRGIRCNMIAPGSVQTAIQETSGLVGVALPPLVRDVIMPAREITGTRRADPREVATVALFLASGDASFVNGAIVTADGGWGCY